MGIASLLLVCPLMLNSVSSMSHQNAHASSIQSAINNGAINKLPTNNDLNNPSWYYTKNGALAQEKVYNANDSDFNLLTSSSLDGYSNSLEKQNSYKSYIYYKLLWVISNAVGKKVQVDSINSIPRQRISQSISLFNKYYSIMVRNHFYSIDSQNDYTYQKNGLIYDSHGQEIGYFRHLHLGGDKDYVKVPVKPSNKSRDPNFKNLSFTSLHKNFKPSKKKFRPAHRAIVNPVKRIPWHNVNNTRWVYKSLHRRKLFNYFKYHDRIGEDKQQIKSAYQDVKHNRTSKARKVYKLMWIKDYDFVHHGESWKNTARGMAIFNYKNKINQHQHFSYPSKSNGKVHVINSSALRNPYSYSAHEMIPTNKPNIYYTNGNNDAEGEYRTSDGNTTSLPLYPHYKDDEPHGDKLIKRGKPDGFVIRKGFIKVGKYPDAGYSPINISDETDANKLFKQYHNNRAFQFGYDDSSNDNSLMGDENLNGTVHANMLLATSKPYQAGWIIGSTSNWSPSGKILNNPDRTLSDSTVRLSKIIQWGAMHPKSVHKDWYNIMPDSPDIS